VADDYAQVLGPEWKRIGNEFLRRDHEWVQLLSFNPSRFDDRYVPRSALQFLWMEGTPTASIAVQELQHETHRVQRWISPREHEASWRRIAAVMIEQFRPRIDRPMNREEIKPLLEAQPRYWPHAYALGVTAAVDGDCGGAAGYVRTLREVAVESSNVHITKRCEALEALVGLCGKPEQLQEALRKTETEVLKSLRLPA
jgi:hypothetical protein